MLRVAAYASPYVLPPTFQPLQPARVPMRVLDFPPSSTECQACPFCEAVRLEKHLKSVATPTAVPIGAAADVPRVVNLALPTGVTSADGSMASGSIEGNANLTTALTSGRGGGGGLRMEVEWLRMELQLEATLPMPATVKRSCDALCVPHDGPLLILVRRLRQVATAMRPRLDRLRSELGLPSSASGIAATIALANTHVGVPQTGPLCRQLEHLEQVVGVASSAATNVGAPTGSAVTGAGTHSASPTAATLSQPLPGAAAVVTPPAASRTAATDTTQQATVNTAAASEHVAP